MARIVLLMALAGWLFCQSVEAKQQLKLLHSLSGHETLLSDLQQTFNDKNGDATLHIEYADIHDNEIQSRISPLYPTAILMPADKLGKNQSFLSPIPSRWLPDAVDADYLPLVTIDTILYGIPIFSGNHLLLYYNKKLISQPATTWQELLEQSPALLQNGISPIGLAMHSPYFLLSFLKAFGGGFFDQQNQPALDSPANLKALRFYKQQKNTQIFASQCGWQCGKYYFHSGKVAYSIDVDNAAAANAQQLADNFGVALLPDINGNPMAGYYTTVGLFLPHQRLDDAELIALKRLIDYLSSMEVQTRFALDGYLMPVHRGSRKIIDKQDDPVLSTIYTQLQRSHASPNNTAIHHIWVSLGRDLPLYLNGQLSAEQVLANAQQATQNPNQY